MEEIQKLLGVADGARGMGGKMLAIKNLLVRLGYPELPDVVTWERTPLGAVWKAGPKLADALRDVRAEAGGPE